jgi:hypothetical protein
MRLSAPHKKIITTIILLLSISTPSHAYDYYKEEKFSTTIEIAKQPLIEKDQLSQYRTDQTSQIKGRINLKLKGNTGRFEYSGYTVYAIPAIPWAYWWAHEMDIAAKHPIFPLPEIPAIIEPFVHKTTTDEKGWFTFTDIPPGKWIIGSLVHATLTRTNSFYYDRVLQNSTTYYCDATAAVQGIAITKISENVKMPVDITAWSYQDSQYGDRRGCAP